MMRTQLFLRAASLVTLLFAIGHTMGGRQSWSPVGDTAVLQAMKSFHFQTLGVNRSYWDFYRGFGLTISILLFLQSIVFWQLATLAKADPARLRPLIASGFAAYLACTLVAWKLIFAVPVVMSATVALLLGVALLTTRRAEAKSPP